MSAHPFRIGDRVQLRHSTPIMTVQALHPNGNMTCWYDGPDNERIVIMSPSSEFRPAGPYLMSAPRPSSGDC